MTPRSQSADKALQLACSYCGLPVKVRRGVTTQEAVKSPQYCCVGCRFASAVAQENGATGQARWTLTRLGLSIFFSMHVMVFTMALWSWDVYDVDMSQNMAGLFQQLFRHATFLFSAPVMVLLGKPLAESAWASFRRGEFTTDLLLISGVVAAFAYSTLALLRGHPHVYFEVSCMVLVAVTLGRWLEATGKLKTTNALESLQRLLPDTALVLSDDVDLLPSESERTVPLAELAAGMTVHVLAGQRIPTDGVIVRHASIVDEQMITGESRPCAKQIGDRVFGGSMVLDCDTYVRATAAPHEGTLQRIVDQVRAAAESKSAHVRFADRCVHYFSPLLFLLTIATFSWHMMASGFQAGLMASLAVVLIACPCALGIATPLALWAGIGRAARAQVLFRDGDTLDVLSRVRTICLDKTGTISTGALEMVSEAWQSGIDVERVRPWVRTVASRSTHPVSQAICDAWSPASAAKLSGPVRQRPGLGVEAHVVGLESPMYLGNKRWMAEVGCDISVFDATSRSLLGAAEAAESTVWVGWDKEVRARFTFREQLRSEARQAVDELKARGIEVIVLTGDTRSQADALSKVFDVPVHAELLPEEKQQMVQILHDQRKCVAMVGDGVNDAPALATAHVGIAMGCGADASRDAAGVCLLGNDLRRLAWTLDLARATTRTVKQNLVWAFAYNLIGVGLAVGGMLNPIFAAAAMVGSSLWVIGNSLRLSAFPEPTTDSQPVPIGVSPSDERKWITENSSPAERNSTTPEERADVVGVG